MLTDEPDFGTHPAGLWASAQVTVLLGESVPEPPDYGSQAWLGLRANDPRRAAAIITAAERWRRTVAEQARLDQLAEDDPEQWWREITRDADRHAARMGRGIAEQLDLVHRAQRARAIPHPARDVVAAPGWPVAIPGRPGWWRHHIDGQQVDRPARTPDQHGAAA